MPRQQELDLTPERFLRIAPSAFILVHPFLIRGNILTVDQSLAFEAEKNLPRIRKG